MAYNWKLTGHKKQVDFFSNAINRNKLAHAYIFAGPQGVGKKVFAKNLAKILLCENNEACDNCRQCTALVLANNADFLELSGTENIKIEQIRTLLYQLALKPYLAKYKVAVIDNAENLTDEAANALLKNLEEPKPNTIVILITASPDRLPRTISSRAQKINFGLVPFEQYQHLLPQKLTADQKNLIAEFAQGFPGIAIKIAADENFVQELGSIKQGLQTFTQPDRVEKLKLAYDLADLETPQLRQTLDFWLGRLSGDIRGGNLNLASKLRAVAMTRQMVDQNVNVKLLLTNLMLVK